MAAKQIQWFPGHMAKTRRMIGECLPLVDAVIEIADSRIPLSSRNPDTGTICSGKPILIVLSKASLADPTVSAGWKKYFEGICGGCVVADFISGEGMNEILPRIRAMCSHVSEKNSKRGVYGKALRAMVVGIPNVGKSSFINRMAGAKKARTEDRPGVTVDKQWVKTDSSLELLDTPGVLWHKFDDRTTAENLALTGAIKDDILDVEELGAILCSRLSANEKEAFCNRYKLSLQQAENADGPELLELVGRKRGFLLKGGDIDTERTAIMLLDEFRGGKIGRISLERPPQSHAASLDKTQA